VRLAQRISLGSLLFAAAVALALTALGGLALHRQQQAGAVTRAQLAAGELASRAERLLALGLNLGELVGFDQQCRAVIESDPLLAEAALFDATGRLRFHSGGAAMAWPAAPAAAVLGPTVLQTERGALALRPFADARGQAAGYAAVQVDRDAVLGEALRPAGALAGLALLLFGLGVWMQQWWLWRALGRPLERLVDAADRLQPDDPLALAPLAAQAQRRDDIGRVYAALARLLSRLLDARQALLRQNEQLETLVGERTAALERLNAELQDDLRRRQLMEAELRTLATTDALTGLANRSWILPHARQRAAQARRSGHGLGLMLIDLDRFKAVNDAHGHAAGDAVLQAVAHRLRQAGRDADAVARLGGDEFLVVFEPGSEPPMAYAQRVLHLLLQPITHQRQTLAVGASIGLALLPEHAGDFDRLMHAADRAMYRAKRQGGGIGVAGDPPDAD
jgi:diguanylate cyclase (GGDEF)-like protein